MALKKSLVLVWIQPKKKKAIKSAARKLGAVVYLDKNLFVVVGNHSEVWSDVMIAIIESPEKDAEYFIAPFSVYRHNIPEDVQKDLQALDLQRSVGLSGRVKARSK